MAGNCGNSPWGQLCQIGGCSSAKTVVGMTKQCKSSAHFSPTESNQQLGDDTELVQVAHCSNLSSVAHQLGNESQEQLNHWGHQNRVG